MYFLQHELGILAFGLLTELWPFLDPQGPADPGTHYRATLALPQPNPA